MRTLLLMRGAPGCGKSTFIDKNGLRPFALSADEIRLMCQAPVQTVDGKMAISQNNEATVWSILFNLLETRMQNGEFTVIDATNSKTEEMNRYKSLADTYRYRMFIVDMTDVPIEDCKKQNLQRDITKHVPENVIDKMYSRFKTQKVPSGITVIKPNELDRIWYKKVDFSQYEKIIHIGDVHGCYTALKNYLKTLEPDEEKIVNDKYFYIFVGDYIDRGVENAEVLELLFKLAEKKNVLLLEGNHERWLWIYANGGICKSKEFEYNTKPQIQHLDTKQIRMLYRKLGQAAYYTYGDKTVFVCHGGIARVPEDNLLKMATSQFINGVGTYSDSCKIAETWNGSFVNCYQIHGHRNVEKKGIDDCGRVFNLAGEVEYGEPLRAIELSADGFKPIYIDNPVYRERQVNSDEYVVSSEPIQDRPMHEVIADLRKDRKTIQEKNFGHISSFNFTHDVFLSKRKWNDSTTKARGLYIDVDKEKVAARSFDKFFNIDEMPSTKFDMLPYTMQFPVTAYVKENGFLGIVSYDEYGDYEDNLFVATKSSVGGDYATWLRTILKDTAGHDGIEKMREYCRDNSVSLIFECIDPVNDPHIIEYNEPTVYLLACVKNSMTFDQVSYDTLCNLGKDFNVNVKTKAFEIPDWQSFCKWYQTVTAEDYLFDGKHIEGFVVEGANGFMVKIKLYYYLFWKKMRGVAAKTLKSGYITHTGQLFDATSNEFYGFLKKFYSDHEDDEDLRKAFMGDIISLRNMFYES